MQTASQDMHFNSSADFCDYGKNGNLARGSGSIQARREESQALTLPDHAVLCGLAITSLEQPMKYDDDMLVTLDGAMVAGSADWTSDFDKEDGLAMYDWAKIVGMPYHNGDKPVFCLGGDGTCELPLKKATTGSMKIALDDVTAQKLSLHAIKTGKFALGWVTTGAGSDNDCKHTPFLITVAAKYVIK